MFTLFSWTLRSRRHAITHVQRSVRAWYIRGFGIRVCSLRRLVCGWPFQCLRCYRMQFLHCWQVQSLGGTCVHQLPQRTVCVFVFQFFEVRRIVRGWQIRRPCRNNSPVLWCVRRRSFQWHGRTLSLVRRHLCCWTLFWLWGERLFNMPRWQVCSGTYKTQRCMSELSRWQVLCITLCWYYQLHYMLLWQRHS